jgi:hypothetical protein
MKLGSSQRGTGVPALVAFMVLAGVGVALAGMPEPSGPPEPSPSVSPSLPDRSGHHSETPGVKPSTSPDPVIAEGCTAALETGTDALERQHGLDRAIEVILENCGKAPQATGLLTALWRLEANQGAHGAGQHGGQPNQHANDAATHERGPSDTHGSSDDQHGANANGAANSSGRDTPAAQH